MKLISLKVKGITSLRREQTIHFAEIRPTETLFAITGPTGSGKSSLLTAVFLALFGKPPKNLKSGDIITLGESEGLSELTFQLRGVTYIARWRCRIKNKKGEILAQPRITRELESEGEQLDTTIESLLNLDIDQFSKTIIINQGQFAEFLTSSFKKRRKILENLCHAEVLGKIAPQLRLEIKELNQQTEVLQGKIEGGLPFEEETYAQYCQQKKREEESLKTLREFIPPRKELLRQHQQSLKNIQQLQQMSKDRQKIVEESQQSYKAYQKAWEEAESLSAEAKKQYAQITSLKTQQQEANKRLHRWEYQHNMCEHYQTQKTKLQKRESELCDKLEKSQTEKNSLTKNQKEIIQKSKGEFFTQEINREIFDKVDGIITQTTLFREKIQDKQKEFRENEQQLNDLGQKAAEIKEKTLNELKSFDSAFAKELTFTNLEALHDAEELQKNLQIITKDLSHLDEQREEGQKRKQKIDHLINENEKLKEKKKSLNEEFEKNEREQRGWEEKINSLREECEQLSKLKKDEEEIQQVQDLYQKSLKFGHCLVCQAELGQGAHEHTPTRQREPHSLREIQDSLEQKEAKLEEANNHQFYLSKSQKEKQKEYEQTDKEIQQNLDALRAEASFFRRDINDLEELPQRIAEDLKKIQEQREKKVDYKEAWSNFTQLLSSEIKRLKELRKDYQSKISKKKELEEEISNFSKKETHYLQELNKLNFSDPETLIRSWEEEKPYIKNYLKSREEFKNLEQQMENDSQTLKELSQEREENEKEQNSWQESYETEHTRLKEMLKDLTQEHEGLKWGEAQKNIQLSSLKIESSPEMVRQMLEKVQRDLDKLENFYREKEEDHRQKLKEKEQKKNYYEQQRQLKEESIQQTKDLLLAQHSKILLEQKKLTSCFWWKDANSSNGTAYKEYCDKLYRGLEKTASLGASAFTKELDLLCQNPSQEEESFLTLYQHFIQDILEPYIETHELIAKEFERSIIQLQTNIDTYEKKGKEQEKWKKELSRVEKQKERKQTLEEILGKDEFSRFAMGFIEQQIMTQANWELKNLCEGRYELVTETRNKSSGPEFFVKDLWKNAATRPINSLSGGETFLVSLAMALGLAELSRGQTDIESLIIDEGFGTLDEDAIEDVLGVLQSIQARGKQIGIISHVKGLTDRIPMNFHLEKNHFGESTVELRYQH